MTRLLVADDHEVVRAGVRHILQGHPGWEIVAEAENGKEAVAKAIETKPDVAIVDYSLPLMNGIEVTRQIRSRLQGTEVLIFTMHDSDTLVEQLLNAGARGYLLKSDANKNCRGRGMTRRPQAVLHKQGVRGAAQRVLARPGRSELVLTDRERGVVQLIAEGHTNKKIGELLHISLKTVESHRAAAMRKLNLNSSAALVRYAIRNRIVEA